MHDQCAKAGIPISNRVSTNEIEYIDRNVSGHHQNTNRLSVVHGVLQHRNQLMYDQSVSDQSRAVDARSSGQIGREE